MCLVSPVFHGCTALGGGRRERTEEGEQMISVLQKDVTAVTGH